MCYHSKSGVAYSVRLMHMQHFRIVNIFLLFITPFFLMANNSSLNTSSKEDLYAVNMGQELFNITVERYWSGKGTVIGNVALLERAKRAYSYIANPAIRYQYMANIALYIGRMEQELNNRAKARLYFAEAMQWAEKSLSYNAENSDVWQVRAESGYAWVYSRILFRNLNMIPDILEWNEKALALNPENISAHIVQGQILLQQHRKNKDKIQKIASYLESIQSQENIDKILLFRSRMLLSQIHKKWRNKQESDLWLKKANEVFSINDNKGSYRSEISTLNIPSFD